MLEDKRTKVKITFFIILVGISCMFTAVVTDYWAVLSPRVEKLNTTCEAAHFGLWRLCKKSIFIVEETAKEKGCGPISLPGAVLESCTWCAVVKAQRSVKRMRGPRVLEQPDTPADEWLVLQSFMLSRAAPAHSGVGEKGVSRQGHPAAMRGGGGGPLCVFPLHGPAHVFEPVGRGEVRGGAMPGIACLTLLERDQGWQHSRITNARG
ncbi:hypothetical protein AAFF_G00407740 [Aldrovandia affinis]|uniref:Voltage-dependent calcium channel gamma-1 subunit n=1 Tax=Aldrovandia affinis TaxID=143900 RepID=A0AAD7SBR4_9TELE|nr:hypothetical protein AAFF_G00407740 [Aldrovandia affinis]